MEAGSYSLTKILLFEITTVKFTAFRSLSMEVNIEPEMCLNQPEPSPCWGEKSRTNTIIIKVWIFSFVYNPSQHEFWNGYFKITTSSKHHDMVVSLWKLPVLSWTIYPTPQVQSVGLRVRVWAQANGIPRCTGSWKVASWNTPSYATMAFEIQLARNRMFGWWWAILLETRIAGPPWIWRLTY